MISARIDRVFSGWDQPFLPWLASYLIEKQSDQNPINLQDTVLVLPGANAMRRLLTLLVLESEAQGKGLIPPQMLTPGDLCEFLLPPKKEQAQTAARMLGWIYALQNTPDDLLSTLLAQIPKKDDFRSWLAFAKRVDTLHREISSAGLRFSDVAARGAQLNSFLEEERWEVLEQVAELYRQYLNQQGRVDRFFDRLQRLENTQKVQFSGKLILAGVVDVNHNIRRLLDILDAKATVITFAPQELSASFDSYGGVIAEAWQNAEIPVENQQLAVVETPKDVVGKIYVTLKDASAEYAKSDISLVVGDEKEIPYIKDKLKELSLECRSATGRSFQQTLLGSFLQVVSQYLTSHTYQHFSRLVRHPISFRILQEHFQGSKSIEAIVDSYQEKHLQAIISSELPRERSSDQAMIELVERVHQMLVHLLGPALSFDRWMAQLLNFFEEIEPFLGQEESGVLYELSRLVDLCAQAVATEKIKNVDALALILQFAEESISIADTHGDLLEIYGWLEAVFDDSPMSILTSLNEGVVPKVVNSDPFLPNTLRAHLGLVDNNERYARDAYVLLALLKTKKSLTIALSKRELNASPRIPSRLLLACAREHLPLRIAQVCGEGEQFDIQQHAGSSDGSYLQVQEPLGYEKAISSISVTAFAQYIACPYRFFLTYILRAREVRSDLVELDPLLFGNLIHLVLYDFAQVKERSSTSPEAIAEVLDVLLDARVQKQFGSHEYPAIRIQIEHLRERLKKFSFWQANRNKEGWQIVAVEKDIFDKDFGLSKKDITLEVHGRIDRIDYHAALNLYQIIDYKSGDKEKEYDQVYKNDTWLDLQIPLYMQAAKNLYQGADVEFIYLNLSQEPSARIDSEPFQDTGTVASGLAQAVEIAKKVEKGIFWPPASINQRIDSYDWILGVGHEDLQEDQGGEAHE